MFEFRSQRLARALRNFPGYKRFGRYSLIPIFFLFGAGLEYVMINWKFGEINFYRTFKQRQVEERAEAIIQDFLKKRKLEGSQ